MYKIVLAREDDRLFVGRNRRPRRLARFRRELVAAASASRSPVRIRSTASACADSSRAPALPRPPCWRILRLRRRHLLGLLLAADHRLPAVDVGVALHLQFELELRVVLRELHRADRQVLRVVRSPRDLGQHRRHLGVVEHRRLGLLHRIDQVEIAARGWFRSCTRSGRRSSQCGVTAVSKTSLPDLRRGPMRRPVRSWLSGP